MAKYHVWVIGGGVYTNDNLLDTQRRPKRTKELPKHNSLKMTRLQLTHDVGNNIIV